MKIVIDIPEDVRVAINSMGLLRVPDEMQKIVDKAIQHSTPLPGGSEILTKEAYSDLCTRAANVPNFEIEDKEDIPMEYFESGGI